MSDDLKAQIATERARCCDLLEQYARLARMPGVNVSFAVMAVQRAINYADTAIRENSVPWMETALQRLKECE